MGNQRESDRRSSLARRQRSERRRPSDARRAIIEVCRSTLHLALVVRGGGGGPDKVVTRSVEWRKEAPSLLTDLGRSELADAFRTLVAEERLAGTPVRIALSNEYCVTRVLTGPTESIRREFDELEERSHRYLSRGPGPQALARSVHQLDARHQHLLLAVANRRTLDTLMEIADDCGVQIESIEPSLVALSRAQAHMRNRCQDASLIVQVDEVAVELGVCHQGRLLLDYRPGGRITADTVAEIVAQHIERLQRYLDRYHSYLGGHLQHIYLTGSPASVELAHREFARLPQFQVHVLDPSELEVDWQHTADTPGTQFTAALGTALLFYPSAVDQQGPNLIEKMLAELREPIRPILLRSLAPLAATLLLAAGILGLLVRERSQTADLRAELQQLLPARVRATELRLTLGATDDKLRELHELDQRLPRTDWGQLVMRISQSMPDDVWLDRISFRDGQLASLNGASYTDGGVYDFTGYLKEVPGITQINLQGTGVGQSPTGPTTNFDIQLSLVEAASAGKKEN
jgi:Tfp pilus assembly PilM family ATPase/Tfp pilus assembly protein PilN